MLVLGIAQVLVLLGLAMVSLGFFVKSGSKKEKDTTFLDSKVTSFMDVACALFLSVAIFMLIIAALGIFMVCKSMLYCSGAHCTWGEQFFLALVWPVALLLVSLGLLWLVSAFKESKLF